MKKSLLIALAVVFAVSANAQLRQKHTSEKVRTAKKGAVETAVVEPASTVLPALLNHRRNSASANQTQSAPADVITLCTVQNYTGVRDPNSCLVWYDQTVNSVSFTHRSHAAVTFDPNSNYFRYDVSKDGGNNWDINQGPIYSNPSSTPAYLGRFPQGLIVNPSGGSNPDNAFLAYDGLSYGAVDASGFYHARGAVQGVGKLDYSTNTQGFDTLAPYVVFSPDMFVVKNTKDIWKVGQMFGTFEEGFPVRDSLVIKHGVWNSTSNDYDFTTKAIYLSCDTENLGGVLDLNVVFNDAGTVGYIAMVTNDDVALDIYPDQILYPSVLKTTDGGQTWFYPQTGTPHPDIINVSTIVDTVLYHDPTALYGTTFDLDVVMDGSDNLHIITEIAYSSGYGVYIGDSISAMFDIYTEDQGATWLAQMIAEPTTFSGVFGANTTAQPNSTQYNRQFASRNWDGSMLFFSWFDTDTIYYGVSADDKNNKNPDLFTIGYDVAAGLWTDTMNLTRGGDAYGQCAFAYGSYYVIDSTYSATNGSSTGNVFSIPVVYCKPENNAETNGIFDCFYVHNANVDMTIANRTLTPLIIPAAPEHVSTVSRAHTFSVSSNYPNPFNGKTSFNVSLNSSSDVTVEVSNMLGEILSFNKYSNLNSGKHTLTIDANKLSAGVYFYKVRAGNDQVTKKMTVQ